jgi:DNA-binding NtrC family response regulator
MNNFKNDRPIRLFLIDDDPGILEETAQSLISNLENTNRRIDIVTANHGLAAQKILEKNSEFDLIITDGNMNYCNGVELIKFCKDKEILVPVIVYHGGKIQNKEFIEASPSCTAVIIKPGIDELREAVLKIIT